MDNFIFKPFIKIFLQTSLMLLVVLLCGLVSITLADPTMYGAAPAKYPSAPVPYPVKYETPAPPANKYETPTTTYSPPNKYETPITTTTVKYETPKYEKKMEEYPTMKYGAPAMRYRRAADVEEEKTADPAAKVAPAKKTSQPAATVKVTKLSAKTIKLLRDAVIESVLSDPLLIRIRLLRRPLFGLGYGGGYFDDEDEFF